MTDNYMLRLLMSEAEEGEERMLCKNHPNLRWSRRSRESMKGRISQNVHLMFLGDIARKLPGSIAGGAYGDGVTSAYECPCTYGDLEFIEGPDPALNE